jgi:hypothetical protein
MGHHRTTQRPGRYRFIPILFAAVFKHLFHNRVLQEAELT